MNPWISMSEGEKTISRLIALQRGRANAISIAILCQMTEYTEREIKGIVEQLIVTHGLKIGSSRVKPFGYFMIIDQADLDAAICAYRHQILSMWRRLGALAPAHYLREMHGQLTIEPLTTGEPVNA